jgi:formate hydrogenlyase subunit 6/NADH:ubiquinone oxidoreductase subunit I
LAELFYQYLNVEEDFIKQLFCSGETQLGRVFVHETALSAENSLHVLDYERASEIVKTAHHIGVGICYCRHKMEHVGRSCASEQDICLTFNNTAAFLTRHGIARSIDITEGLDLLQKAQAQHLVQFGENVRRSVNFICNCCGKCVEVCPVEALGLVTANDPKRPKKKVARLNKDLCLGCAVCVTACPQTCISLASRLQRVITPLDSTHRAVVMAIERGKLQNLIFDVQAHWNHRAMASRQMKSRYLEYLLQKLKY